jgi:hypothetical protein
MFGAIMAGLGLLMKAHNKKQTLARQNAALQEQVGHQQGYQTQASHALGNRIAALADQRAEPQAVTGDYLDAVREAMAPSVVPGASDAYQAWRGAGAADNAAQVAQLARLMGAAQAPAELRQREGFAYNDLAGRLATLANAAGGQANVDKIGYRAIQPDAGTNLLANGLIGYGMSNLNFGGGGSGGTQTGGDSANGSDLYLNHHNVFSTKKNNSQLGQYLNNHRIFGG